MIGGWLKKSPDFRSSEVDIPALLHIFSEASVSSMTNQLI